jgi:hypothetical protein
MAAVVDQVDPLTRLRRARHLAVNLLAELGELVGEDTENRIEPAELDRHITAAANLAQWLTVAAGRKAQLRLF